MLERSRRVALLIDYDNLQICASRDTPGRDLQLEPVVRLAQRYGSLIVARAYAEWNLSTERLAVYKSGIEPAFAPVLRTEGDRTGKSLADTVMVAEGMDILWTQNVDVVVLATSDKDLIPLVRAAKQRGAKVVVVGSDLTAIPLREMADEHVTYKQLINDASARFGEFQPGRQPVLPSEPVRRAATTGMRGDRERGREREPRAAGAAALPPAVAIVSPVAPVIPPLALDDDGTSVRRPRRRRGGRRRGERMGEGEFAGDENGFASQSEVAESVDTVGDPPQPNLDPTVADDELDEAQPAVEAANGTVPMSDAALEPGSPTAESPQTEGSVAGETNVPADVVGNAGEGATAESEVESADAKPAPRPRARRVASASRGRTRTVAPR